MGRAREEYSRCIRQRSKLFRSVPSPPQNRFKRYWFVLLLKPYRWARLCWGAQTHEQSVQSLRPANIVPAQAILEQLRDTPITVGQRVQATRETADRVLRMKQFLYEKGMRGETVDSVARRTQELERHLGEVSSRLLLAREVLRKEIAGNRKAIKEETIRAWLILETVEDPLQQHLKLLKEWQAQYYEASSTVQKVCRAVENARRQLEEVPKSIDLHRETAELEKLDAATRKMEQRHRSPTIEILGELLRQAPSVIKPADALAQFSISLRQRFRHLGETIVSNANLLMQVTKQMTEAAEADIFPLVWQESRTEIERLRSVEAAIGPLGTRRTPEELEQHLEMASDLGMEAQTLSHRVASVRRQREELIEILKTEELTGGLGWMSKVEDLRGRIAPYSPLNWKDENVVAMPDRARALAKRQEAVQLTRLDKSLQEQQLSDQLNYIKALVTRLGEFHSRLNRVEKKLSTMQQEEKDAADILRTTLQALAGLNPIRVDAMPDVIVNYCKRVVALEQRGQSLRSSLEHRDTGLIFEKASRVREWQESSKNTISNLLAEIKAKIAQQKTRLQEAVDRLEERASFSREPTMQRAKELLQVSFGLVVPYRIRVTSYSETERSVTHINERLGTLREWQDARDLVALQIEPVWASFNDLDEARQEARDSLGKLPSEGQAVSEWPISNSRQQLERDFERARKDEKALKRTGTTLEYVQSRVDQLVIEYRAISKQALAEHEEILKQQEDLTSIREEIQALIKYWGEQFPQYLSGAAETRAIRSKLERIHQRLQRIQTDCRRGVLSYDEIRPKLMALQKSAYEDITVSNTIIAGPGSAIGPGATVKGSIIVGRDVGPGAVVGGGSVTAGNIVGRDLYAGLKPYSPYTE